MELTLLQIELLLDTEVSLYFWNIETSTWKNFSIFWPKIYCYVFVFFFTHRLPPNCYPFERLFCCCWSGSRWTQGGTENTLPLTSAPSQIRAQNFKTICEIYLTKGTKWPKMMNNPAARYGPRHA